jgi:hypothetical protein
LAFCIFDVLDFDILYFAVLYFAILYFDVLYFDILYFGILDFGILDFDHLDFDILTIYILDLDKKMFVVTLTKVSGPHMLNYLLEAFCMTMLNLPKRSRVDGDAKRS